MTTPAKKATAAKVVDEAGTPVEDDLDEIEMNSVTWRGGTFEFPKNPDDWPVEAVLALEQEHAFTMVKALLGDQQWEELLQRSRRRSAKEVGEVMDLVAKASGFKDSGE